MMKKYFKAHKYLYHSISVLVALLAMIGFDSDSPKAFLVTLGETLFYAAAVGLGLFILQTFSGWILWPFIPKYEDFKSEEERDLYFKYERESKDLLFLYIYLIIAFVIVFVS